MQNFEIEDSIPDDSSKKSEKIKKFECWVKLLTKTVRAFGPRAIAKLSQVTRISDSDWLLEFRSG